MAFPTTAVLDAFTGTNGTDLPAYSANWTTIGTSLEIQSNAATGTISGSNLNYWNVANFGADSEVYFTINTVSGNGTQFGVLARIVNEGVGTSDGYYISGNPLAGTDAIRLNRIDNGTATQLGADFSQALANGDAIGMEIVGSTLTAYYKASGGSWTSLGTRSDSTYSAAGKLAILSSNTVVRMDDFGGGTVESGAALSSAGEGSASFTAASIASAAFAMPGAGVMTMQGAAIATSVLAAAGAGELTMEGAAIAQAVLASDGAGTLTMEGASTAEAAAAMASDGAGTLTMEGAAIAAAEAAMVGASTVQWVGASTAASILSAEGVGVAQWVGASIADGAGDFSMAGASTVEWVGASTASSEFSAEGAGVALFIGEAQGAPAEEPAAAPGIPLDGGAWSRRKSRERRKIKREDEELVALIRALAPDLMQHRRRH